MNRFFVDLGKYWLEWRGRERAAPRYEFQENEVVSPGYSRRVSNFWKATYLNLHPAHYAIAVGPDGKFINLKGGYNLLSHGRYIIYYVDRQNRISHLPLVEETTYDGFNVAIGIAITYRLIDPIQAVEVQNPVATLFSFIQSDLKKFISSHKHSDFFEGFNGHRVHDVQLANYIKEEHNSRSVMARLFSVMDVVVKEIIGDPMAIGQPKRAQSDQRQEAFYKGLEQKIRELELAIQEMKATPSVKLATVKRQRSKVFICYKKIIPDLDYAEEIYKYLCELGYSPWMDIRDIVPGQDWRAEIQNNIRNSDYFIAILSNSSVTEAGFMQQELKDAYDKLAEVPEGRIFIIPVKIDQCKIPDSIRSKHSLDWSSPNAKELLHRALELRKD